MSAVCTARAGLLRGDNCSRAFAVFHQANLGVCYGESPWHALRTRLHVCQDGQAVFCTVALLLLGVCCISVQLLVQQAQICAAVLI